MVSIFKHRSAETKSKKSFSWDLLEKLLNSIVPLKGLIPSKLILS